MGTPSILLQVRYRDGYDFDGGRIRVEMMRGGAGGGFGGPPQDVERMPATSQFRVIVEGLPKYASASFGIGGGGERVIVGVATACALWSPLRCF